MAHNKGGQKHAQSAKKTESLVTWHPDSNISSHVSARSPPESPAHTLTEIPSYIVGRFLEDENVHVHEKLWAEAPLNWNATDCKGETPYAGVLNPGYQSYCSCGSVDCGRCQAAWIELVNNFEESTKS